MNNPPLQPKKIKVALGSDHAGWRLKTTIKEWLSKENYQVLDVGCDSTKRVDFVAFAQHVATLVSQKKVDYGVLCCFSGVGMTIAANRFCRVRAVCVRNNDVELLRLAKQHNDVNLLCLGSNFVDFAQTKILLETLFSANFTNLERYCRRNQMLDKSCCSFCSDNC